MPASTMTSAGIIELPAEQRDLASDPPWSAGSERRIKFRYPLDLTVRYRCCSVEPLLFGEGLAVNISSGGVLVASQHQMSVGALVELSIEWPLLLDGRIPLQLMAFGRVLRSGDCHFAASVERHEFRTMKSSVQSQARGGRGQHFDLIWSSDTIRSVPGK
jgi:hypothetical protein